MKKSKKTATKKIQRQTRALSRSQQAELVRQKATPAKNDWPSVRKVIERFPRLV
jgi:hypothetical protein